MSQTMQDFRKYENTWSYWFTKRWNKIDTGKIDTLVFKNSRRTCEKCQVLIDPDNAFVLALNNCTPTSSPPDVEFDDLKPGFVNGYSQTLHQRKFAKTKSVN